jgi:hypothetical protein
MIAVAGTTRPPKAWPIAWWPRQTPRSGVPRLGRGRDQRQADAGAVGVAGAGRQHDRRGVHRHRLLHVDFVVAAHHHLRAELAEVVDEVVGEAVVVVDQQQHSEAAEAPAAPPAPEAAGQPAPALAPAAPGALLRGAEGEALSPGTSLPESGGGPSLVPLE